MAKKMMYEAFGMVFQESYWILAQANSSPLERTGKLIFYGYADKDAFLEGRPPIGQKQYIISNEEYGEFFNNTGITEAEVFSPVWQYAELIKEGMPPIEGEDTRVSFFYGAEDVI